MQQEDCRFFGSRFSLYPMTNDFVDVIVQAIAPLKRPELKVTTDDVSTCLVGPEKLIFDAMRDMLADAADTGHHVVMSATFSKGCPDEGPARPGLQTPASPGPKQVASDALGAQRLAACQFSVYPLGTSDYMDTIYSAIDLAKARGLYAGSAHFCSRTEGSLERLFDLLYDAFALAAERADHVVMTATVSCNSPSPLQ